MKNNLITIKYAIYIFRLHISTMVKFKSKRNTMCYRVDQIKMHKLG